VDPEQRVRALYAVLAAPADDVDWPNDVYYAT
jgi:hypothetical protein